MYGGVEVADDMGADEPGRTGDKNGERFGIHAPVRCVNLHHCPVFPDFRTICLLNLPGLARLYP
jgi:hypothetical protein